MTKKILILLVVVISIITIGAKESKQAKNQKKYAVKSRFLYSDDEGRTYKSSRKEFKVGKSVYMKLYIEITETEKGKAKETVGFWGRILAGAAAGVGVGAGAGSAAGTVTIPVIGSIAGGIVGAVGGGIIGGVAGGFSHFYTKPDLDFVNCELIIPNVTHVDAKYLDGTTITPKLDTFLNTTTYPIKITIGENSPAKAIDVDEENKSVGVIADNTQSFILEFMPNDEGYISIKLIFDDNIGEQYDKQNTVKFVK